jgi:hypothetical protein
VVKSYFNTIVVLITKEDMTYSRVDLSVIGSKNRRIIDAAIPTGPVCAVTPVLVRKKSYRLQLCLIMPLFSRPRRYLMY